MDIIKLDFRNNAVKISFLLLTPLISINDVSNAAQGKPSQTEKKSSATKKTNNPEKTKPAMPSKPPVIEDKNPYAEVDKPSDKKEIPEKKVIQAQDKNPYLQPARNVESVSPHPASFLLTVHYREGFALNSASSQNISFNNYTGGGGIGMSYYFMPNFGLNIEGNIFKGTNNNSFFIPISLMFRPLIMNNFELYTGAGGFVSYVNNQLPIGAIAELGGLAKITRNFGFSFGIDWGMTLIPVQSQTLGAKSGLVILL